MATQIDVTLRLIDMMTSPLVRVQNEMERTARAHQRMGRDIQRIGDGFSSVGESMLPIAAGITAIGAAGGRAFIDFDSIITGAAAKAGATAEEMEMMRQKASQFGADFPISATQAAEGMDRLAAAGYDANQVIGVMPSVITAAVASGEDLATTSDVVSNALNIWNLKQGDIAQNAMRVADVVQMAANKSSLGMADFGLAMQYAGAPAATLNVSIEQLATAMAIMKNNGIEASTIGTSLRSVFSRLSEPPKPAAEAIEALGLQVKDASGNFLGLQPIVEQLRGKILNLSNTEQVAYAKALAGEEAYSGLLALVKTAPEEYQALQNAMDSATGSSQAQFEVMKGTLKNSIDGMLGSLESLAINFGSVLTPQIKAMTDAIGGFADMINTISPETKLLIGDILMGTVAFTGFTLAAGKAVSIGGGIVKLYGDIGRAAMGGSIHNKALQFAVLNTANAYKTLKDTVIALKTTQNGNSLPVFTNISTKIKSEYDKIRALKWADITTAIVNAMPKNPISFIKTTVITRLQKIRTSAILATESLLRMYRTFYMSKAMESFANGIGKATKSIFGLVKASFAFALTPLGIALIAIAGAAYLIYKNWDMVGPYFISLWKRIETALIGAWNKIKPAWDSLMNVIPKLKIAISPALVALDNIFTMAINGQGAFEPLIAVLQIVASIFGGVLVGAFIIAANVLVGTVVAAINVAAAIITGFLGVLEGIITFLTGVFTGNWEMAWQGIVKIFDSVFSAIKGIADGILGGVKETINGIIKSINSIQFTVPDIVPGIGGKTFGGLNIPLFANGVENFSGGPAIIHDKGAEIVDLPSGTRVIPHDKSLVTAYMQGQNSIIKNIAGMMNNVSDTVNLSEPIINIKQNKMPQNPFNRDSLPATNTIDNTVINNYDVIYEAKKEQPITKSVNTYGNTKQNTDININVNINGVTITDKNADIEDLAYRVAQQLYYQVQKRSINMNEGAV
ncbi:phage tail tape measure protein [Megamonas funiformis]|jgi:TP901 family phage tail tape measure protein|uniref:phage tail tape measure protein n=1 Tax=Megamonas funiformis TaxID=437897 RepID=UPI00266FF668|nr:phage tail tape measure protein [Megamonas funiformis]